MRILLFAILALLSAPAFATEQRPNVVLILADDLGWGDLSCYPQDRSNPDSNPLYPRASGGAGAEGMKKQIFISNPPLS